MICDAVFDRWQLTKAERLSREASESDARRQRANASNMLSAMLRSLEPSPAEMDEYFLKKALAESVEDEKEQQARRDCAVFEAELAIDASTVSSIVLIDARPSLLKGGAAGIARV